MKVRRMKTSRRGRVKTPPLLRREPNRWPARRRSAFGLSCLTAAVLLAWGTAPVFALDPNALPSGGRITAGQGSVTQSGATMQINQASPRLAADWQSFNIGANAAVTFNQPNAGAVALNRVVGADPSQIFGRLSANGQVFLLNPNGVLFASSAQVNVGALVASSRGLSNEDFLAGRYRFSGNADGAIINQGSVVTSEGGYVALIGAQVSNEGSIVAPKGNVQLAAGNTVTLTLDNGSLTGLAVEQGALNALAQNKGLIRADGGRVYLTAQALDSLTKAVVNNEGIIEAHTVENRHGTIVLLADMAHGETLVGGTLDASAPEVGDGGFVETSGAHVKVADGAKVTTLAPYGKNGAWLIDPQDYFIAASGGDITGATLSSNLGFGDVTILSSNGATAGNGDIFVNDVIPSWAPYGTALTLNAARDIVVNASINASIYASVVTLTAGRNINVNANIAIPGDGTTLTLGYGSGGGYYLGGGAKITITGNFPTLKIGVAGSENTYQVINNNVFNSNNALGVAGDTSSRTLQGLVYANSNTRYALGIDIDASATSGWNGGQGFTPGSLSSSGVFDGLGHTISNLTINRAAVFVGLYGSTSSGSVAKNVGLVNASITNSTGGGATGGLAGQGGGTIINSYVTGSVTGPFAVGGLAGQNVGSIQGSYNAAAVSNTSGNYTGGLAGTNSGAISGSYNTGTVGGVQMTGGLVGYNTSTISGSYNTGAVSSNNQQIGGLAGQNAGAGAVISNSYNTGSVTSSSYYTGGLVGFDWNSSTISNSYNTGAVSGSSSGYNGGIAGYFSGATITNSYWNTQTSGSIGNSTGTGLTTAQMNLMASFSGWSIANSGGSGATWRIYEGSTYPLLRSFLTPLTVTANAVTRTYNAVAYSGGNGVAYAGFKTGDTQAVLSGTLAYGGTSQGARNAGSYAITPTGLYGGQQGYDIAFVNGVLTITPASLTLSTVNVTKIYDGNTTAAGTAVVTGGTLFSGDSLSGGSSVFTDKNAGNGNKTVTISGVTVNDGNSGGNYTVSYANNTTSTINPYAVNITGSRVYDGTANVAAGMFTLGTLIGTETLTLTGSGTVANKNVGTGKTVTLGTLAMGDGGGLASNYTFSGGTQTANITTANLNITGVTAANKVYNATAVATLSGGSVTPLGSDAVTLATAGATGSFADKNVGTGKTVTASGYTISGTDAANYALVQPTGLVANITTAPLTITAALNTKTYDGGVSAAATPTVTGLLGSDMVTGLTESYADKNAGTGKTLSVNSGYMVNDGNAGANYTVSTVNAGTGVITQANLNVTANNASKTHDELAWSGGNGVSYSGFANGETSSVLSGTLAYGGTAQGAVNAGSYTIVPAGLTSGNYAITFNNGVLTIVAPLTATANAAAKAYGGLAGGYVFADPFSESLIRGNLVVFNGALPIQSSRLPAAGARIQIVRVEGLGISMPEGSGMRRK